MVDQLVFQGCSPDTKSDIRRSWNAKREDLERLLRGTPAGERHVRVTVRRYPDRYEARTILVLPTGTLVADAAAPDADEAMSSAVSRLRENVRRHRDAVRRRHLRDRKVRGTGELAAAGLVLEDHSQESPDAAFFERLRPFLRSLRHHAHRELVIGQLRGEIDPGDVSVSELLDEVLVRAHERLVARDPERSWESELVDLLHEVLDERVRRPRPDLSIDMPIPADDPRYEAELGWVEENEPFWGIPEPLTLEDVLPDADSDEIEDRLTAREQRDRILGQLGTLPDERRRAFALRVLEGWDEDEIAALQGRSASEIRADIEKACRELAASLPGRAAGSEPASTG